MSWRSLKRSAEKHALALAFICLAGEAALVSFLLIGDQSAARPQRFILISVAAAIPWIGALYFGGLLRRRALRLFFSTAVIVGLALRVGLMWGGELNTHMSDDVYRYVWDGKVTAHGMNPFGLSPDQLHLTALPDSTIYPYINHSDLPTIYPPMSQFFFVVSYLISSDSIIGFKLVTLIAEILTLLIFTRLAREYELHPSTALIYWLAPLALLEFSYSSHQDMLALPFLGLGLIFIRNRLPGWSGVALTAATLCKFIVGFAIPALFLCFSGRERIKFAIAAGCSTVALYIPYWFILHPPELFGSLFTYLGRWQYNGSTYTLIERALSLFTSESADIARLVTLGIFVALSVWTLIRIEDRVRAAALTLLGYVCLTSTLFPWYLAVFFPFLVIRHSPAVVALMSLIGLSYWGMIGYLESGLWYDNFWLRALSYAPFYILLLPRFQNLNFTKRTNQEALAQ